MKNGTVQITGIQAIDQVFRQLPQFLQRRVLRSAFVNSTKHYRDVLKAKTPVGKTGNLKRSVGTKPSRKYRSLLEKPLWVGHIAKRKGGHAFLADQGRKGYEVKRSNPISFRGVDGTMVTVTKVKPAKGHHFIEPTWMAHRNGVIKSLEKNIGQALHNFMKRTIKKNA